MRQHLSTAALVLVLLTGLGLLLYPTVADTWNSIHQTTAISRYVERVTDLDDTAYTREKQAAQDYNGRLTASDREFLPLTQQEQQVYENTLNVSGTGIMGYIDIPAIHCTLPIYHGAEEAVLQVGVGHLQWSTLPVGGPGTHCVLSAHRGLPSARLFTDIDRLTVGDTFRLNVLGDTLTYEVRQIRVVLPEEMDFLRREAGADLCTLVTCTPYGVNSHRLLVQGSRVDTPDAPVTHRVTADALQIRPILIAPFAAIPILAVLLLLVLTVPATTPEDDPEEDIL